MPVRHPRSLAGRASGYDRLIGPALALAGALLVSGWFLPFMTVERLLVLSDRFSLIGGTVALADGGDLFLAAVLGLFSIVFPAAKLLAAALLWFFADADSQAFRRYSTAIDLLGKWSMLDVFVVAVLVVTIKSSIWADVNVHYGIYVFAAAVALSMVLVRRLLTLAGRLDAES